MDYYSLVTALFLVWIGCKWSTQALHDGIIKACIFVGAAWGAFNVLSSLGYVVRISG